jgi:hypothetical protein
MKFDVFQINFTNKQVDEINNSDVRPAYYNEYLDTTFRPTADAIIKAKNQYQKVATIEASNFSDVFEIGNIGPESKITRIARMHSVSVGDVIVREDGVAKFVAPFGFESVAF